MVAPSCRSLLSLFTHLNIGPRIDAIDVYKSRLLPSLPSASFMPASAQRQRGKRRERERKEHKRGDGDEDGDYDNGDNME